jgi:hypothetical protein
MPVLRNGWDAAVDRPGVIADNLINIGKCLVPQLA